MIEIEKKFALSPDDENRLLVGAEFLKDIVIDDTYWDTADFAMTKKDWWLRNRDGSWELKVALHAPGSGVDQYREILEEKEIADAMALARRGTLEEDLRAVGYEPIIPIVTTRRKYRHGEFGIDIDFADFGYAVAEIELMLADGADRDAAANQILAFARTRGLSTENVRGKVLEYLARFRPDHYRVLRDTGIAPA